MAQPPAGWTAALPALAPALRACLGRAGPGAFATTAESGPGGEVAVTLWRDGAATLCRAGPAGGPVLDWRPLAGLPPPDPAAPAFFLERRCADARRIDAPQASLPGSGSGRVLGWLAYPAC